MNDFKKNVIMSLIDNGFFDEFSHKQINAIKPTINSAIVNTYIKDCKTLSLENNIGNNIFEIKSVVSEKSYEQICKDVINTTLEIFSYVQGQVVHFKEGNDNLINEDGKIDAFCAPKNMTLYCAMDKLFNDIESFDYAKCSSKISKRIVRGIFR